ncbi:hypothetical protein ACROYT_G020216 [Oculina patagonica]
MPPIQAEARLKDDIKAINTITITVAAYFLCYVPAILYAVVGSQKENLADAWFGFIAWYSVYISSTVNPVIYYLRKPRCRNAFKQFLKDPFGSSDFKEKPNGLGGGEKRHNEVMARKRNGEKVESGEGYEGYAGKRRNALVIVSIEDLDDVGEAEAEKGVDGSAPNLQVQDSEKEEEAVESYDEVPKKRGLKQESRKRQASSCKTKVYPQGVIDMATTIKQEGQKQEVNAHCTERETCDVHDSSGEGTNGEYELTQGQVQEQKHNQKLRQEPEEGAKAGAGPGTGRSKTGSNSKSQKKERKQVQKQTRKQEQEQEQEQEQQQQQEQEQQQQQQQQPEARGRGEAQDKEALAGH